MNTSMTSPTIQAQAEPTAPPVQPKGLDPHTENLVVCFASHMKRKLLAAQQKYGYTDGWRSPDWMDECRAKLLEHIAKGDPVDVANYCAFLWFHGASTATGAAEGAEPTDAERDPMIEPAVRLLSIARWAAGKIAVERERGAGYRHAEVEELLRVDAAMCEWLLANGWRGDVKTAPTVADIAAIRAAQKGGRAES